MPTKSLTGRISNTYIVNEAVVRRDALYTGQRVGQDSPGWRKKIKDGRSATSPMSLNAMKVMFEEAASFRHTRRLCTEQRGNPPACVNWVSFVYSGAGFQHDITAHGFNHAASVPTNAEADVLAKLYNKIRSDSYTVNSLMILGELRETINLLRNPLEGVKKGLTEYFTALKSNRVIVRRKIKPRSNESKVKLAVRRRQALSNMMTGSWLQLQFGVAPMISDAKDIVQAVDDILSAKPRRSRLTAKSKTVEVHTVLVNAKNTVLTDCLLVDINKSATGTADVQYKVGFTHRVEGPSLSVSSALETLGFQFQNFVPTMYELLPWSFLIDYFVNLGDIIEAACTSLTGLTWVCRTERQITDFYVTELFRAEPGKFLQGFYSTASLTGKCDSFRTVRRTTLTRTVPTTLPLPPLTFSIPGESSLKWVNMAALLAQAQSGFSKSFRF